MKSAMAAWFLMSAIGVLIIAWPDDDRRLVSFSEAHGPSAVDAVGIGFLLVGWIVFVGALVRRRACIARNARGRAMKLVLSLLIVGGIAVTLIAVVTDLGWWWLGGVLLLVLVQLWLAELASSS